VTTPQIKWISRDDPPDAFPDIDAALAVPNGLLAAGGDLSSPRLLHAYEHGIFPWFDRGQPILWWSPDPRCVLPPEAFHVARRLRRTLKHGAFEITWNRSFDRVIAACAEPRPQQSGTWITADMMQAFGDLHRDGWAHSVEVWLDRRLVGGIYGLASGGIFFGESMFSRAPDASKTAMFALCRELARNGFELLDCQLVSPHLLSLGASPMPRREFGPLVRRACERRARFTAWPREALMARGLIAH
jgi:leucyl/phenylalanyl-tRNA---protein transferase